ncbi:thioredoxin-domain-containing protein [Hypoxylon sp. NC1633]|nr:thioredoxin-domain-containing protein [Hypoxylon sp. NC1633]
MSTNAYRAAKATFRHSIYRPSPITYFRHFHTTLPKMTVHNLGTAEAFKEALKTNNVVLLDCFATWCGPCKAIAPLMVKHSNDEKFKDIFFAKIDVDDLPELSQELGVTAMPTFLLFKDGNIEPAEKLIGANPPALAAILTKYAP